ncbi:MAG: preprotein translocase subunit SecE [Chloroflexota bacterium]
MATIGKEPATESASPNKPGRQATAAGGSGSSGSGKVAAAGNSRPSFIDKQRENIRNITAELRKVTWPTREETRNLTIVVIGITVVLGTVLATMDTFFAFLYRLVNP